MITKTLYYNAHLLDENTDCMGSVLVENKKISKIILVPSSCDKNYTNSDFATTSNIDSNTNYVDLKGLTLTPSFIDMHTHLRDPGLTYKEEIATGLAAAKKGGFSVVVAMANTSPVISSAQDAITNMERAAAINNGVRLIQAVSITRNFDGRDVSHLLSLNSDITPVISEDGHDVNDAGVLKSAMEIAAVRAFIVACHCQSNNSDLRRAEDDATIRNLKIALETNCKIHICHVSTKGSVDAVKRAKAILLNNSLNKLCNVTCEVTPHHLLLTEDPTKKVNPPLRAQSDIDALISAIKDGTIDAISSDHAPHSTDDKLKGAPGFSGLETSFAAVNTVFNKYQLDKKILSRLMAATPARILCLNQGCLKVGYDAKLCVVDLTKNWVVHGNDFLSRGKYSAFEGMTLAGSVEDLL